jgi:hypothetical protein
VEFRAEFRGEFQAEFQAEFQDRHPRRVAEFRAESQGEFRAEFQVEFQAELSIKRMKAIESIRWTERRGPRFFPERKPSTRRKRKTKKSRAQWF